MTDVPLIFLFFLKNIFGLLMIKGDDGMDRLALNVCPQGFVRAAIFYKQRIRAFHNFQGSSSPCTPLYKFNFFLKYLNCDL